MPSDDQQEKESARIELTPASAETLRMLDEQFAILKGETVKRRDRLESRIRVARDQKALADISVEETNSTLAIIEGILRDEHTIDVRDVDVSAIIIAKEELRDAFKADVERLYRELQEIKNEHAAAVQKGIIRERREHQLKAAGAVSHLKEYERKKEELGKKSSARQSEEEKQQDFKDEMTCLSYSLDLCADHESTTARALAEIQDLAACLRDANSLPPKAEVTKVILAGIREVLEPLQSEVAYIQEAVTKLAVAYADETALKISEHIKSVMQIVELFQNIKGQIESPANAEYFREQITNLPALLTEASQDEQNRVRDTVRRTVTLFSKHRARSQASGQSEITLRSERSDLRYELVHQAAAVDVLSNHVRNLVAENAGLRIENNSLRRQRDEALEDRDRARGVLGKQGTQILEDRPVRNAVVVGKSDVPQTPSGRIIAPVPGRMPSGRGEEIPRNAVARYFLRFLSLFQSSGNKPRKRQK